MIFVPFVGCVCAFCGLSLLMVRQAVNYAPLVTGRHAPVQRQRVGVAEPRLIVNCGKQSSRDFTVAE